nr:hypothetical protein [Tanacetum cinerariifolium]
MVVLLLNQRTLLGRCCSGGGGWKMETMVRGRGVDKGDDGVDGFAVVDGMVRCGDRGGVVAMAVAAVAVVGGDEGEGDEGGDIDGGVEVRLWLWVRQKSRRKVGAASD